MGCWTSLCRHIYQKSSYGNGAVAKNISLLNQIMYTHSVNVGGLYDMEKQAKLTLVNFMILDREYASCFLKQIIEVSVNWFLKPIYSGSLTKVVFELRK